ncbi:organomercurial lyase [Streptomyces sp. NPDC001982]|uniref:organomercurial lyase n=1 Tax=Streptomyces sp. NPDC001982 TaxID=3154405 RepID=UPI00331B8637
MPSSETVRNTRPRGPVARSANGARRGASRVNFFTSRRSARSWARNHPDYTGKAIDQAGAEALGRSVFGSLMADDHGRKCE